MPRASFHVRRTKPTGDNVQQQMGMRNKAIKEEIRARARVCVCEGGTRVSTCKRLQQAALTDVVDN